MNKKELKYNQEEVNKYFLGVRVVSTLSLLEGIFMLAYVISDLLCVHSVRIINGLNIQNPETVYISYMPHLVGLFIIYISFIFINYLLVKNKNIYAKKIMIGEIVVLIIFMTVLYILFRSQY